jgi:23S rRNA pseudouridine1911/1915/1917 synthase
LLNGLLWHAREWPRPKRPSIVGRLDRLTSGVVLVAKSRSIHASLQRILTLPDSLKLYLAVVHGRVSPARGTIDLALARQAGDRRRVAVSQTGSPSRTRYVRLAHGNGLSLVRCQLVTGRLHQIRVHLRARGWPIVGDPVYGRSDPAIAFPRQALHAWRLAFDHPATGCRVEVEAALPSDIRDLLARAGLAPDQNVGL